MTLEPGSTIEGKYRLVRLLGKGGMGSVYEGENERIHRRVAIKVLHSEVSDRADIVQRFEREAQAAGRIGSAHIVEVLDLGGLPTGERFMVMEYLDGESLGARLKKRERLTPHEFAPVLHQLLEGLAAAHEAHIIHRDLKPDNIYLVNAKNQQDFVKILDFGVSKFTAASAEGDLGKTSTGMIMGTPYYMSPEQVMAKPVDARSDIYSVGVMVYYAVTGKLPFTAKKFTDLAMRITVAQYDPPESVVPMDPQFAAIIAKAMHHDREQRFQTAREFQAAVAQWMATNSVPIPGFQRNSLPPTSVRPGVLMDPTRSSISGGMALGTSHITPMGTSNVGLGISQSGMTTPTPKSHGLMIALGLFGTLFLAVSAILVYTFIFDKPAAATPTETTTASIAPATAPPPPTNPIAPATQTAPSVAPEASAVPSAGVDTPTVQTPSTAKGSSRTSGGGAAKTPPVNTGRKMTGEL